MGQPRILGYDIRDILGPADFVGDAMDESLGAYQNSFGDAVSPGAIASGDYGANVTVSDGFLKSSNFAAGVAGWQLTATTGEFNFPVSVDALDIPDTVTANSFHVDSSGNAWWGATAIGSAVAKVLNTGAATFTNVTLSGSVAISGIANSTATDISLLEFSHDILFSSTDEDTVSWSSGTITMSNGRTFSISAGNTGNMTGTLRYIIYLDTAISTTVLQKTTTVSSTVGANRIILATAKKATTAGQTATFVATSGIGGLAIDEAQVFIANLAALNTDMGSITAGTITLNTSGYIKGGQSAYDTGTGFFLGYSGGAYKFSLGVDTGQKMTWDGSTLSIKGSQNMSKIFTFDETVVAGDCLYIGDGKTGIEVSNSSGDPGTSDQTTNSSNWFAINYTTSSSCKKIRGVALSCNIGAGVASTTVSIRTVSGGVPTGSDIETATAVFDNTGGNRRTVYFLFSTPVTVSASTTYAIIFRSSDNSGANCRLYKATSGSNSASSTDAGSNWSSSTTDYICTVYEVQVTEGNVKKTDATPGNTISKDEVTEDSAGIPADFFDNGDISDNVIGFAYAATNSGSTGYVVISGVIGGLSGLTTGGKYYVSGTPGGVTSTAPTRARRIGIAVSTTELLITNIWDWL